MTGSNFIRKLLIFGLISTGGNVIAQKNVRIAPQNGALVPGTKSVEGNPTSDKRNEKEDEQDNRIVKSLLQQLTAGSDEPIIFVPRAVVPTRSLWAQHYETSSYPRASHFRPGGSWRKKNKNTANAQKRVVPDEEMKKRELVQSRLNSLRLSKLFPDVKPTPPTTVPDDQLVPAEKDVKESIDGAHPLASVPDAQPPSNMLDVALEATLVTGKTSQGLRNEVPVKGKEVPRQPVNKTPAPLPPVKPGTEGRSGFFSWPPSWWPFSSVTSSTEPSTNGEGPTTPAPKSGLVNESQTPAQLNSTAPPSIGKIHPAVPLVALSLPLNLKFVPIGANELQGSTSGTLESPGKDETQIPDGQPPTTSGNTETADSVQQVAPPPEQKHLQFIPVKPKVSESQAKSLLTTKPGQQILIPVPIRFLILRQDNNGAQIPKKVGPEYGSPVAPVSMTTEPTTLAPTGPPTTLAPPTTISAPIGYEVRFVPIPSDGGQVYPKGGSNKIKPFANPPLFRHGPIPVPVRVVNNFNPRFQLNEATAGKARAALPAQTPKANGDKPKGRPGKLRLGAQAPNESSSPEKKSTSAQATSKPGEPERIRILKDGSRVLPNGMVVPAGFKCPYGK